ncbi:unnamed protein product, partial [Rotaria sp. Silwood2]
EVLPGEDPFECESQSLSSPISNIISVKEPMIVTFPCDKPVRCSNIQLPPTTCINTTVMITTKYNTTLKKQSVPVILFNKITDRLVLIYKNAAMEALTQLQMEIDNNQWWVKKILKQFGNTLLSLFACVLLSITLLIIKISGCKNNKQVENIQTQINRIQRDILQEI